MCVDAKGALSNNLYVRGTPTMDGSRGAHLIHICLPMYLISSMDLNDAFYVTSLIRVRALAREEVLYSYACKKRS